MISLAELVARTATGPRLCFITDIHARNRAPRMRADNYRAVVIEKLGWVCEAAKALGAEPTILGGGDIFDVPKVDLEVADDLLDVFIDHGCVLATVFGNHDLEASLTTVPRTVLGHLMRRSPGTLVPLPLLTSRTPLRLGGLHIWGHHYRYQNHLDRLEVPVVDVGPPRVVISHSMILAEKPVFEDYTLFDEVETNAHLVLLGHYHPQQPMRRLKNEYATLIGGPGALLRGALSRDELTRKPCMAVIEHNETTHELLVDFVPIECARPADEVFKLEQAQAEARHAASLEAFRSDLDNLKVQGLNLAQLIESISKAEGIPEEVRQEALRRIGVV